MKNFPEIIKDGDLELRHIEPTFENARMIFDALSENRSRLENYFNISFKIDTIEQAYEYLKNNRIYMWAIFLRGEFCGEAGFGFICQPESLLKTTSWIIKKYEGTGLMTRAWKLLEKEAFDCGYNRIERLIFKGNVRSAKLAEKLGYVLDGVNRKARFNVNGENVDEMVFSKLKSEWEKENKNA